jgi:O-antigen ligase
MAKKDNQSQANKIIFLIVCSIVALLFLKFADFGGFMKVFFSLIIVFSFFIIAYLKTRKTFLTLVFLVPFFIGLDDYQINIGAFLELFSDNRHLDINLFTVSCIAFCCLALIEIVKNGTALFKAPLFSILTISVLLNSFSLPSSEYKSIGAVFWLYLVTPFCVYFTAYFLLKTKKNYLTLIAVIISSSLIPIIISIKQLIVGEFHFEADTGLPRLLGSFPHSNTFGSYLFVIITVYIVLFFALKFLKNSEKKKIYFLLLLSVFAFFLLLTFSRTPLIGLFFAILIMAFFKKKIRVPAFVLGFFLSFVILIYPKTRQRILNMFERNMYDSLYGRFEIWDMAWYNFKAKPWIGYGIGSFEEVIKETRGSETGNVYPHNDSFRFLLEGGIAGFIGYLLYLLGAIFYSIKSYLNYKEKPAKINFLKQNLIVDFKILGLIPFLLFVTMIPISLVEAPSMDFVYQILAWSLLGGWMAMNSKKSDFERNR